MPLQQYVEVIDAANLVANEDVFRFIKCSWVSRDCQPLPSSYLIRVGVQIRSSTHNAPSSTKWCPTTTSDCRSWSSSKRCAGLGLAVLLTGTDKCGCGCGCGCGWCSWHDSRTTTRRCHVNSRKRGLATSICRSVSGCRQCWKRWLALLPVCRLQMMLPRS